MTAADDTSTTLSGPALFSAGNPFSAQELQCLCMDGVLTRVFRGVYAPVQRAHDAALRADAVRVCLPSALEAKVAAGRETAAWIYGCSPEPESIHLMADRRRRPGLLPVHSGCRVHQVHLAGGDIQLVGSMPVTSVLRTAVDLCLYAPEARCLEAVAALTAGPEPDCSLKSVTGAVEAMRRVPGRLVALRRLAILRPGACGPRSGMGA